MPSQKAYNAPDIEVAALADALVGWLQPQGYETQTLPSPGGLALQARQTQSTAQKWGGGVALNVTMYRQGDSLSVQIGTSKWATQAVSGVAAAIIFWPLMALPAWVAYKQKQMIDEAWLFIDQYVATSGQSDMPFSLAGSAAGMAPKIAAEPQTVACPCCGQSVDASSKFCSNCGSKLTVVCPDCGKTLRIDAKFCDDCGARIDAKMA